MAIRRKTKKPSVPKVTTQDVQMNKFTAAVHELMDIWNGNKNPNDRVVTQGDLVDSGGFSISGVTGTTTDSDLVFDGATIGDTTPPAKVSGVTVDAGLTSIFISWTALSQLNISYYEVWRNSTDTLDGTEVRIGTSVTPLYADAVGDVKLTYYYWVRGVNTVGITGPMSSTLGLVGGTAAIVNTSFASSLTAVEIFGTLPVTDNFTGRQVLLTTDKKLYRYDGAAWTNEVDGGDISSNSIVTGSISTGAIKAAQIDASAVTAGKIAAGSVTADRMNVTQLSAIAANLGSITAGALSINNKFIVDSNGNTIIRSGTSGARLLIENDVIKVYDSSGTKRVQIGDLTA